MQTSDCLAHGITVEPDLAPGDVVNLIVGGPDMVVLDYCPDCGTVDVAWFNGDSLEIASLPEEVLV